MRHKRICVSPARHKATALAEQVRFGVGACLLAFFLLLQGIGLRSVQDAVQPPNETRLPVACENAPVVPEIVCASKAAWESAVGDHTCELDRWLADARPLS